MGRLEKRPKRCEAIRVGFYDVLDLTIYPVVGQLLVARDHDSGSNSVFDLEIRANHARPMFSHLEGRGSTGSVSECDVRLILVSF